ncbi:MAG: chromosome partitioning protein ParB [Actinomycetota bacterium]|nr:chromosome partitioning protein ParB [Actinomycetota bacterium]
MSTGNFRDTGSPRVDAQTDFTRARRRRALARLASRLRREPADFDLVLPFEEVVAALGRRGERHVGLESIPLDSIVGTVGRGRDFDRGFRPTSGRTRGRWERIATAARQGESFPPIDVYRIGEVHFVKDGHHRVSVARAQGLDTIDAYVTEVQTEVGADRRITLKDLPVKGHERLFYERVPLPREARQRIQLSDEWRYAGLAEGVEAWGFRLMQDRGEPLTREQVAREWFEEEYVPVVEMLREADLLGTGTETEAYIRISALRYLILRTHEWTDSVIERLRPEL